MAQGSDKWLIPLLPILAVTQAFAGQFNELTGIGTSIADRSRAAQTAAVPADYAFIIWAVIFLWSFAFAIDQARPSRRHSEVLKLLRRPAAAAFALNTIWELNAQLNSIEWVSFALIVALLLASLAGPLRLASHWGPIEGRDRWIAAIPLHILAGWISVATFAHLSSTAQITGGLGLGAPASLRDVLLVLSAAGVGAFLSGKVREPIPYAGTILWGLGGIVAANVVRGATDHGVMVAAIAGIGVVGAGLAWALNRWRPGGRVGAPQPA